MAIRLSLSRTYTIPYEDKEEDISFSVTFKFPDPKSISTETDNPTLFIHNIIKNSIEACEGFINIDDGQPISVKNSEGVIDKNIQEVVFGVIKPLNDYMLKVVIAIIGPTGKNLLAGVMQQSSGAGTTPSADHVSKESVIPEDVSTLEMTQK